MTTVGILTIVVMSLIVVVTTTLICTAVAIRKYIRDKKDEPIKKRYDKFIAKYGNNAVII